METLGFPSFAVAGHDRGGYVAYRTALDHPERVSRLAVLGGIPIIERLEQCDARFAQAWWHWFFYGQPDKPERANRADPEAWYGAVRETDGAEAYANFLEAIRDPATVHGLVNNYRAGLGCGRCGTIPPFWPATWSASGDAGLWMCAVGGSIAPTTWRRRRRRS